MGCKSSQSLTRIYKYELNKTHVNKRFQRQNNVLHETLKTKKIYRSSNVFKKEFKTTKKMSLFLTNILCWWCDKHKLSAQKLTSCRLLVCNYLTRRKKNVFLLFSRLRCHVFINFVSIDKIYAFVLISCHCKPAAVGLKINKRKWTRKYIIIHAQIFWLK